MRQRQPASCGVETATTFTAVSPMGTGRGGSRAARRGTRKACRPRPAFTSEGDGPPAQTLYTIPWCPCVSFALQTPSAFPLHATGATGEGTTSSRRKGFSRLSRPRRRGHGPPRSPPSCLPLCVALRSRRSFALTRHPPDVADGVDLPFDVCEKRSVVPSLQPLAD